MPKYIKKKDLKNAIDECTWYHIGKNGELVEGANSSEHEPLYKYSDIKEIIKNLPTRKFETEPKHTALSKALKWTYGDEPNKKIKADRKTEPSDSEKPNNSDTISRQAAISAICNACGKIDCDKMDKCEKLQLPPANCSEFPNNCEHITEDGVTCAKYPACDDCLDNPLNKVKGSERLVKGSEQTDCLDRYDRKTEPTISKMEQVDKDINVRSKDEPQTGEIMTEEEFDSMLARALTGNNEPQTDCAWR